MFSEEKQYILIFCEQFEWKIININLLYNYYDDITLWRIYSIQGASDVTQDKK
jgi:hypothetical protein